MKAVVIGASGGIGAALAAALEARGDSVVRLSRRDGTIDLAQPDSVAAAARRLSGHSFDLALVATGILAGHEATPERLLDDLTAAGLAEYFAVNAIGPALVLRHFAPLLPRSGRSVIAALSARVGSIADNRLGGWYGYRASKAALNQIVRSAAIELARTRPDAICVALHPGTVATSLAQPFLRSVAPGQLVTPAEAADRLLEVISRVAPEDSGQLLDWTGARIAP